MFADTCARSVLRESEIPDARYVLETRNHHHRHSIYCNIGAICFIVLLVHVLCNDTTTIMTHDMGCIGRMIESKNEQESSTSSLWAYFKSSESIMIVDD